jgi:hypothetical protein
VSPAEQLIRAAAVWLEVLPDGWPGTLLATVIVTAGCAGFLVLLLLGIASLVLPGHVLTPRPPCTCQPEEEDE